MIKHKNILFFILRFVIIIFSLLLLTPKSTLAACTDNDGDGYGSPGDASCPKGAATDCNDNDQKVYPGAPRICDGKDNDCDGRVDFSTDVDNDHDGYPVCVSALGADCNDNNAAINPGAQEGPYGNPTCSDGKDNDCDKKTDASDPGCANACIDIDGDGYGSNGNPACPNGTAVDCNDSNPNINPGKTDTNCNGIDENCSGAADEGYVPTPSTCGVGACVAAGQNICQNGIIVNNCTPGAPQTEGPYGNATCSDVIDNDCDGLTDAADGNCAAGCIDNDSDGYGTNGSPACPNGTTIDCNDNNPDINPGASDANCNGIDENCNTTPDDGYVPTPSTCGVGICARTGQNICQNGTVVNTCNPGTPQTEGPYGNATCSDGLDNNCNGLTDAADLNCSSVCLDNDADGYGISGAPCPKGTAIDCDDTDPKVYPGAPRICDGKDNDCDGRRDFSTDVDNDHDGAPVCAGDCNDNNPNISPKIKERHYGSSICSDGLDNDCDLAVDAADPGCAQPDCITDTSPKNGPHFFTLLNPDGTVHIKNVELDCGKCHGSNFQDPIRSQCQRCHADPNDTSDPLNGVIKAQYPLNPPYGYGSAPNVKVHSSTVVGTKYGDWSPNCVTCHNPHTQEQNAIFDTTYGQYIKETICFNNPSTGLNAVEFIQFTASTGTGSFADGAPYNENVCEMCHTQTNHHRRDGTAPGDLDGGSYVGHYDGNNCVSCHVHSEGFKPSCGACHDAPPPTGTHVKHFGGTKDDAEYGSTKMTKDFTSQGAVYLMSCGNCHPMNSAKHANNVENSGGGDAEIELYDPSAPAGSLKALNPPTASYTPGSAVYTDPKGMKYTQGTCNNVYCHSYTAFSTSGAVPEPTEPPFYPPLVYEPPWQTFVVKTIQYQSPKWGVDSLGCNGCHGYPITTSYPTVSAGVGDSHAWIDDYGYINLHIWNMSFDPLQCNACHYDTVRDNFTWVRDDYSIQLGGITIFNTAKHINGTKEVSFTQNPVAYGTDYYLTNATFDQNTKTCYNVACHLNQTEVIWGSPYRWGITSECNVCHQM